MKESDTDKLREIAEPLLEGIVGSGPLTRREAKLIKRLADAFDRLQATMQNDESGCCGMCGNFQLFDGYLSPGKGLCWPHSLNRTTKSRPIWGCKCTFDPANHNEQEIES